MNASPALNPVAAAVDGLVSAIMGYVIVAMVPPLLTVFYALNSPWYVPALFVVFVLAIIIGEFANGVLGSFGFAVGFLYGAYALQDWIAFVGALALSFVVIYFRYH